MSNRYARVIAFGGKHRKVNISIIKLGFNDVLIWAK